MLPLSETIQPEKKGSSHFGAVNLQLAFSSMLIALDFSPTFLLTWPSEYLLTGPSTGASFKSRSTLKNLTEIT